MAFGIIVDWYGPYYDLTSFRKNARDYAKGDKVLYMAIAPQNVVEYVGISISAATRFGYHHVLTDYEDDFKSYYIGNIESQGISGKKKEQHPPDLKLAEHMLINVLYPKHNKDHKDMRPKNCGVLYSRFFSDDESRDYETIESPMERFPSFIGYNSYSDTYEYNRDLKKA